MKLYIFIGVFALIVFLLPITTLYAQEKPTPTPSDYSLPYPGLLPNQPFYFLKASRDRVQSFFISNPVKKAEFDLLQADKRMQASLMLAQNQNNITLADSTVSKAENYFEEAITKVAEAKRQGMNVSEITKKLSQANIKHQEVINLIEKKAGEKKKAIIAKEKARAQQLGKKVKSL